MSGRSPVRREPPPFRRLTVRRTEPLSPHLLRVTLAGPELEGFAVDLPAASVRLLLPRPGSRELVMPTWNGNEFLLADGRRPVIRTFTPRRTDPDARELDVDVVLHGEGAASEWAVAVELGSPGAVSGPGRGYTADRAATEHLLAGDETAIPAISQLLEVLSADAPIRVHIEVAHPDARVALPDHPGATVAWHDLPAGAPPGDTLVSAVQDATIAAGARIWAAGEAAAMQRIRRNLFEARSLPRAETVVRGYWVHGRGGGGDTAA